VQPIATSSPYPLISVEQAQAEIMARAQTLDAVEVAFLDAVGGVSAEDVFADEDLPIDARSAVDGYAVRAADGSSPRRVLGELTAGSSLDVRVGPAESLRIMTGGLLPPGADAVVMVEDTSEQDGRVQISCSVERGANVTPAGQDLRKGELVLPSGSLIGAPEVGLLATVGKTRLKVYRRPRVAVLATGDELVEPWETPSRGAIRDSNRSSIVAAAHLAGAEVVWQGRGVDRREELERLIQEALDSADILITSGGVSMGTRDLIKPILASLGEVAFGRIAFKPGKPLTFVQIGSKLAFGLPGNPVSSLVTFEVFVRPALRRLLGDPQCFRPRVRVRLAEAIRPDRSRLEYQRAIVRATPDGLTAATTGVQASSRLLSMRGANALLEIPAGDAPLPAGQEVNALLTGALLS
jgi:molybdopterin molybdotransferase